MQDIIPEEKETPKPSEELSSSKSSDKEEKKDEVGVLNITEQLKKLAQLRNKMKKAGLDEKQKKKVLK